MAKCRIVFLIMLLLPSIAMADRWHCIDDAIICGTYRMSVHKGWLVKVITGYGAGITFVPDETHSWKV
jgi:hypothetical protein